MANITLNASQGARLLSGEYDYLNESGSSIYWAEHQGVSTSSTEVAVGSSLSRRAPSWVISGGQSNLRQTSPDLEGSQAEVDTVTSSLTAHTSATAADGAHGLAQAENITAANVAHDVTDVSGTDTALDAMGGKVNSIIAALEAAGIAAAAE